MLEIIEIKIPPPFFYSRGKIAVDMEPTVPVLLQVIHMVLLNRPPSMHSVPSIAVALA